MTSRVTVTDDQGRFVMSGLSAGQYSIAADKDGYLQMNYGASRPSRQGTSVVLADGQRVGGLVIELPRGAAITGHVTNSAGEPEPDVSVTALYWKRRNGERMLVPIRGAKTDDRGEYRISGLDKGDYLISVEPPDYSRGPSDIIQILDGVVDRALRPPPEAPIAGTRSGGIVSSERPRPIGPAPIFFPATARADSATTVTLEIGEERGGVNIRTSLVPTSRLNGTVRAADNQPVSGVRVVLVSLGPPAPNSSFAGGARLGPTRTDSTGHYEFSGVPPGDYRVQASIPGVDQTASLAPVPNFRMGFATVAVDGDDRTVDLTLQPGMSVRGRFVFEGAAAPAVPSGARITFEGVRISPTWTVDVVTADQMKDGTFRAEGLTPGRFNIKVAPPSAAAGAGWGLRSIMANGRDLLDSPFELQPNESMADVVVTFAANPSELSGTLQNASGVPTSDYFIVVFTPDQKFWFPSSRRIVSVRPDTTGTYRVRNLPPGDYLIAALTDIADGEWFDPEFLQALAGTSPVRISIASGEQKRQDLRIGK